MIIRSVFIVLIFIFSMVIQAEEYDPEFDFLQNQKSTLANFPMQEIDGEDLSNAAVEGALQVQATPNRSESGKPAYQKASEAEQKKTVEKVNTEGEKDIVNSENMLKFSQIIPAQPDFQPIIYSQPTGRTYTDHHTTTTSRP